MTLKKVSSRIKLFYIQIEVSIGRAEKSASAEIMMDCYNHGYSKAILDVYQYFMNHSLSLKWEHLYNKEGIEMILKQLVENRQELRMYGDVKLLYNPKTKTMTSEKEYWRTRGQIDPEFEEFKSNFDKELKGTQIQQDIDHLKGEDTYENARSR